MTILRTSCCLVASLLLVAVTTSCKSSVSPNKEAFLDLRDTPNPVPWSGTPVSTAGCAGVANTWSWTTDLTETSGVPATITYLDTIVDSVAQPRLTLNTAINGKGKLSFPRVYCFPTSTAHRVESTFGSIDKNNNQLSTAAAIDLLAKP